MGDRWALLVMRELLLGARRFSDLKRDLPGISANVLKQRLDELEQRGLLSKIRLPPPAARDAYQATPWGLEIEPVIQELGRFAARSPGHDPTLPLSPVSLMMSFRTMIDAKKARGFDGRIGFVLREEAFLVRVRKERLRVVRGPIDEADATITGLPEQIAGVVYGGLPPEGLAFAGDEALARRFLTLFTLPPKVETAGGAS
ncbi:winged helix-turn-helix transcriptional regulator [Sphingomonas glaciei]|uniref:Winged helix-turn-helix transcriptional regulator n=1 Tax=Sphingomonas glaciei TaxID=2938948 RepID=A0ABY5MTZ3_9SPHN|nr:winged helix-turn-helix transcriptional regulator [Sphingomonas glaciei]UUR07431.1 winged helix-turn-helix transcriptional regulator [Sphingomonas glaciei]